MYVRYYRASLIILHRNKHYYSIIYDIIMYRGFLLCC